MDGHQCGKSQERIRTSVHHVVSRRTPEHEHCDEYHWPGHHNGQQFPVHPRIHLRAPVKRTHESLIGCNWSRGSSGSCRCCIGSVCPVESWMMPHDTYESPLAARNASREM